MKNYTDTIKRIIEASEKMGVQYDTESTKECVQGICIPKLAKAIEQVNSDYNANLCAFLGKIQVTKQSCTFMVFPSDLYEMGRKLDEISQTHRFTEAVGEYRLNYEITDILAMESTSIEAEAIKLIEAYRTSIYTICKSFNQRMVKCDCDDKTQKVHLSFGPKVLIFSRNLQCESLGK